MIEHWSMNLLKMLRHLGVQNESVFYDHGHVANPSIRHPQFLSEFRHSIRVREHWVRAFVLPWRACPSIRNAVQVVVGVEGLVRPVTSIPCSEYVVVVPLVFIIEASVSIPFRDVGFSSVRHCVFIVVVREVETSLRQRHQSPDELVLPTFHVETPRDLEAVRRYALCRQPLRHVFDRRVFRHFS